MTIWTPENAIKPAHRVLLKRGDFIDESRDGRKVPYKIYYPTSHDLKTSPVIIWSHGFGGNRDGASFISRHLAGQGYTLIHITHDGTDSSLWEGKPGHPWDILQKVHISRETTLNRFYDVPFVIDQVKKWSEEHPEIGQYMDLSQIGMSGHSFGAMTTQVMAGQKFPAKDGTLLDLKDDRITCGISYSPTSIAHLSNAPPEQLYGNISIPLFHMTGTQDDSPLDGYGYEHRLIISKHAGHEDQYVQILDGGDHMIYNGTRGKLANNEKREEHEQEIIHASQAFWDAYLKKDKNALEWLQAKYKQT